MTYETVFDVSQRLPQLALGVIAAGALAMVKSFGKTECLAVEAQRFCYSEAEVTPGYNRGQYLVGGLATGSYVRLSVIDGLIVRLEVRSGG